LKEYSTSIVVLSSTRIATWVVVVVGTGEIDIRLLGQARGGRGSRPDQEASNERQAPVWMASGRS
jgi:hypothetical protein